MMSVSKRQIGEEKLQENYYKRNCKRIFAHYLREMILSAMLGRYNFILIFMADTKDSSPWNETAFLNSNATSTDTTSAYGDFFQETSDGNISIWPKAQKSGIEVLTTILGYIVPIVVLITWALSMHVFLRTREESGFAENYQFLCPYLNYGVHDENAGCKTMLNIKEDYEKKDLDLKESIIEWLSEYIPIKISKNIIEASPEKRFIIDTYDQKIHPDDVINQFANVLKKATQYTGENNISCNGINITNGDIISTQCTIYGGAIGDDDSNRKLGSARIETLRFTDGIANTIDSHFILLNPPTTLSVEKIDWITGISPNFKTRVTIPIQLKYVPVEQKS